MVDAVKDFPTPVASVGWLADHLSAPGLVVFDASWRMPGAAPATGDYAARHIPGALHFDIDAIADRTSALPHMLPAPAEFAAAMSARGVVNDDCIVVYDDQGLFSAARVWWTFRAMGHDRVAVLEGGLPAWIEKGLPLCAATPQRGQTTYLAPASTRLVASHHDVRRTLETLAGVVIDARPAGRFEGRDPEPRPGLRAGHAPGSLSLPFSALIENGRLKPAKALRAQFERTAPRALDAGAHVIATCGSGVSAAIIALALAALGREDATIYDGAWAEWGRETNDLAQFPVHPPRAE
jgi:thiosulfate/3-mercaptopyruvate sulfurtransferase